MSSKRGDKEEYHGRTKRRIVNSVTHIVNTHKQNGELTHRRMIKYVRHTGKKVVKYMFRIVSRTSSYRELFINNF